jgi:signal peptide peptidase SppA
MIHARIAARLLNTPLMVHPGKAASILTAIGGRVVGGTVEFTGAAPVLHRAFQNGRPSIGTVGDRLGRELGGQKAYDMVGNVAIIPVEGSLVHKGSWLESESGETSYQGLQTQVQRAMRDPNVKGVAFEVDSYGGEVSGAFETSDMIFALSRVKPTIALLSDEAYSGGYLMAAGCRQIILPEQGAVGSIGACTMHTDMSKALEASGVKVTILAAGAHKADGNSFEPLPEDVAATILADLESVRVTFATRVAAYRGARFDFKAAMATEAQIYAGAEAVKRGLADATAYPSDAFLAFVTAINRA